MWCVLDAEDVPKSKLSYDPELGWLHEGDDGWHTVGGTAVEGGREGKSTFKLKIIRGLPGVAAIRLDRKVK